MRAQIEILILTLGFLSFQLTTVAHQLVAQELDQLPGLEAAAEQAPYQLTAGLVAVPNSPQLYLIVGIELPPNSYLYSLTQPGELATRIEVALGEDGKIAGVMRPTSSPQINEQDEFVGGRSEKHYGTQYFVMPVQRISSRPVEQWEVAVRLNGQVCSEAGTCQLIRNEVIRAKPAAFDERMGALLRQAMAGERPQVR